MKNLSKNLFERWNESLEWINSKEFMSFLKVKTLEAITLESVENALNSWNKLNVKFWTDPTWPELHLWHIVPLRVLDLFNRAWHNIDIIFWDFTAKVWDPTGRENGRKILSDEEILKNMSNFRNQVNPYCNTNSTNVDIHTNSSWLNNMKLPEIFEYLQYINLSEAVQRNDFKKRIKENVWVSLAEVIYGTLMWIDSVFLKTDIEIWWIDQLLNFQQARNIQEFRGQKPEKIIMTPIIEWTSWDGRKMSKSYNNYIPALVNSKEIFWKIMSIPDNLILQYFKSFSPLNEIEILKLEDYIMKNPFEAKKQLAVYLSALSSSNFEIWLQERENFEITFSKKNVLDENTVKLINDKENSLLDILFSSWDFRSKSEIIRIFEQWWWYIDWKKVSVKELHNLDNKTWIIIKVWKRKFYSLI